MHRRKFLKMSSAGVFVAILPKLPDLTRYAKYRTALIGTGWWVMNILRAAIAPGQSNIAAICDVDEQYLQAAAAEINKLNGDQDAVRFLQREYRPPWLYPA